ncbi:MAG: hypothetical protein HYW05_05105 [Candidatus Diapherotrites archaeon]|nr:hypothetical protein [Candidatus Diapherotrites archaeon]
MDLQDTSSESMEIPIFERICRGSGKAPDELQRLIEQKRNKFSGLLTEEGAALLVAKELNVRLDSDAFPERMKISNLQDGMKGVGLLARVMQVYPPRNFEKSGKKGMLANLLVGDNSGEVRLTLWNEDAKKVDSLGIGRGSVLLLKNCSVTSYNGKLQLSLAYGGELSANPENADEKELPKIEKRELKISGLQPNLNSVDVIARVARIYGKKEFQSASGKGEMIAFEIADETGNIRAVAWNSAVGQAAKLNAGEAVKIENAYTKESLNGGTELHLGFNAKITQNPKDAKLPELPKEEFERKALGELEENKNAEISASIAEINRSALRYFACSSCGKKLQKLGDKFLCEKCGEQKEPKIELIASVALEDESGAINAICYGDEAEKIFGMGREQVNSELRAKSAEDLLDEIRDKIAGQKIKANGYLRTNRRTSEKEFVIKRIIEIGKEIKKAKEGRAEKSIEIEEPAKFY